MQVTAHVEVTWECPNCTATNEANIFDEGCEVECFDCETVYTLKFEE